MRANLGKEVEKPLTEAALRGNAQGLPLRVVELNVAKVGPLHRDRHLKDPIQQRRETGGTQRLVGELVETLGGVELFGKGILNPLAARGGEEGNDDALDAILLRPVRGDRGQVPLARCAFHFAPDRREACENGAYLGKQFEVDEAAREVGERPADIGRNETEERSGTGREVADIE